MDRPDDVDLDQCAAGSRPHRDEVPVSGEDSLPVWVQLPDLGCEPPVWSTDVASRPTRSRRPSAPSDWSTSLWVLGSVALFGAALYWMLPGGGKSDRQRLRSEPVPWGAVTVDRLSRDSTDGRREKTVDPVGPVLRVEPPRREADGPIDHSAARQPWPRATAVLEGTITAKPTRR